MDQTEHTKLRERTENSYCCCWKTSSIIAIEKQVLLLKNRCCCRWKTGIVLEKQVVLLLLKNKWCCCCCWKTASIVAVEKQVMLFCCWKTGIVIDVVEKRMMHLLLRKVFNKLTFANCKILVLAKARNDSCRSDRPWRRWDGAKFSIDRRSGKGQKLLDRTLKSGRSFKIFVELFLLGGTSHDDSISLAWLDLT